MANRRDGNYVQNQIQSGNIGTLPELSQGRYDPAPFFKGGMTPQQLQVNTPNLAGSGGNRGLNLSVASPKLNLSSPNLDVAFGSGGDDVSNNPVAQDRVNDGEEEFYPEGWVKNTATGVVTTASGNEMTAEQYEQFKAAVRTRQDGFEGETTLGLTRTEFTEQELKSLENAILSGADYEVTSGERGSGIIINGERYGLLPPANTNTPDPDYIPSIYGDGGDSPLDISAANAEFDSNFNELGELRSDASIEVGSSNEEASTVKEWMDSIGISIPASLIKKNGIEVSSEELKSAHKATNQYKRDAGAALISYKQFIDDISERGKLEEYLNQVELGTSNEKISGNEMALIDPLRQKLQLASLMGTELLLVSDDTYAKTLASDPEYAENTLISETELNNYVTDPSLPRLTGPQYTYDEDGKLTGVTPASAAVSPIMLPASAVSTSNDLGDTASYFEDFKNPVDSGADGVYGVNPETGINDDQPRFKYITKTLTAEDVAEGGEYYNRVNPASGEKYLKGDLVNTDKFIKNPLYLGSVDANDPMYMRDYDPNSTPDYMDYIYPQGVNPTPLNTYKGNEDWTSGIRNNYGREGRFQDTSQERWNRFYRSLPVSNYSAYGEPAAFTRMGNAVSPAMDRLGDPLSFVGDVAGAGIDYLAKPFNWMSEKFPKTLGQVPAKIGAGIELIGDSVSAAGQRADDAIGDDLVDFVFQDVPQVGRGIYQGVTRNPAAMENIKQGSRGVLEDVIGVGALPLNLALGTAGGAALIAGGAGLDSLDSDGASSSSSSSNVSDDDTTSITINNNAPAPVAGRPEIKSVAGNSYNAGDNAYGTPSGDSESNSLFGGLGSRGSGQYFKNGINLNSPEGRAAYESTYGSAALDDALEEVGLGHLAGSEEIDADQGPDLRAYAKAVDWTPSTQEEALTGAEELALAIKNAESEDESQYDSAFASVV